MRWRAFARRSLVIATVVGTVLNAPSTRVVVLTGGQPQWLKVALTYAVSELTPSTT